MRRVRSQGSLANANSLAFGQRDRNESRRNEYRAVNLALVGGQLLQSIPVLLVKAVCGPAGVLEKAFNLVVINADYPILTVKHGCPGFLAVFGPIKLVALRRAAGVFASDEIREYVRVRGLGAQHFFGQYQSYFHTFFFLYFHRLHGLEPHTGFLDTNSVYTGYLHAVIEQGLNLGYARLNLHAAGV